MYEKRLRQFSPPEKVFEYFASVSCPDGSKAMMPTDLMRACVPVFAPTGSDNVKQGGLAGESTWGMWGKKVAKRSKFFELFDTNGDGIIDFPEYVFFTTLLSIPQDDVKTAFMMFDLDDSGTLDRDEFKEVLANLREKTRVGKNSTGFRPGMKSSGSVEEGGLVEFFFGKNGKKTLTLKKFEDFLSQLHAEMVSLEFSHYDFNSKGYMSYKDFALSLVASGNVSEIRKYLGRVSTLPEDLPGKGVSLQEFQEVYKLRPRLHAMHVALQTYGGSSGVKKDDFRRAAKKIGGANLTDVQIDILYHVFDLDGDGTLDADEFVNIISHKLPTSGGAMGEDPTSLFGCCKSCWDNRSLFEETSEKAAEK
jgi:Ca2+-binding EF-hand superfamily protein